MVYEIKADAAVAASEGFDALAAGLEALRMEMKQDMAAMARRPIMAPPALAVEGVKSASSVFADAYLRKGVETGFEVKKLSLGVAAEGGLAVPNEIDQRIEAQLKNISPIRQIADVVKVGSANYRKLVSTTAMASGWVSDIDGRTETATPSFIEIAPPMGELYANPAASQAMLDDAGFDVESWLAAEIAREFARAEGVAFVNGTGVNQPKGFLTYPVASTLDGVRAQGTLQYVATGVAGGFAASNPADKLIDLVHSLRAPYRQGASWVMNSNTIAAVRKFKDSTGDYIWRQGLAEGEASTLLGYPVVEVDAMPDIAANSLSIGFGQFQSAYVVAERSETAVLRDPYSNKPFVHFYATRRVGGAVANSEALKLLRFSAS